MKKLITIIAMLGYISGLFGQQETIMTKYTFNSLFFNPAYAGSHGEGTGTATFQYRNQWLGVKGAPVTMLASAEASLFKNSLGVGFTLGSENIGANRRNELTLNSAYRIRLGEGHLSGGLRASLFYHDADFSQLQVRDGGDQVYNPSLEQLTFFGVGFGLYYNDDNLYLGISAPTLASIGAADQGIDRMRHIFVDAGVIIGDDYSAIKWQPSLLIKYQPAVPLQMTLSTQAWLKDTFAVGLHWRYGDAIALSAEFHFLDNWKLSTAYDLTVSELNTYSSGSPEIMLGYKFAIGKSDYKSTDTWYY